MPIVEVAETLAAPVDRVWDLVVDVRGYPDLMDTVRAVDVLEEGEDWALTRWEVELKGSILKWTEMERRSPERRHISYEQVDGDLEVFSGYWQLTAVDDDHTRAVLVVEFEIGIPMLRDMLDPVAQRAIQQNSRSMLQSLAPFAGEQVSA